MLCIAPPECIIQSALSLFLLTQTLLITVLTPLTDRYKGGASIGEWLYWNFLTIIHVLNSRVVYQNCWWLKLGYECVIRSIENYCCDYIAMQTSVFFSVTITRPGVDYVGFCTPCPLWKKPFRRFVCDMIRHCADTHVYWSNVIWQLKPGFIWFTWALKNFLDCMKSHFMAVKVATFPEIESIPNEVNPGCNSLRWKKSDCSVAVSMGLVKPSHEAIIFYRNIRNEPVHDLHLSLH